MRRTEQTQPFYQGPDASGEVSPSKCGGQPAEEADGICPTPTAGQKAITTAEQSWDRSRLRLYLLQPRLYFIEVDHAVPIINDHVPVEVDPATDERDISGRQAAQHDFMWLRSHGYRRSGAPGAAMKSADFDPRIVRIAVVFGNPRA